MEGPGPSREAQAPGAHGCSFCTDWPEQTCVFRYDLISEVTNNKGKKLEETLKPFLQLVNAMMNEEQDGAEVERIPRKICLHTENPHLLGDFDKKVDDKLASMITDRSLFSENFERYFHDKKHVIFVIAPGARPHSTLKFNTKISLNKGVSDPTQGQMIQFVKRRTNSAKARERKGNKPDTFVKNAIVEVKTASGDGQVPFQECVWLQAKPSKGNLRVAGRTGRVEGQTNTWWKEENLCEFISAFSKLPNGGSIFLGIKEDIVKGKQTGKFFPNGIVLNRDEREILKVKIAEKVQQDMVWISEPPSRPEVSFQFHDVCDGVQGECVVEVIVPHFPGLVFYKQKGPESFTYKAGDKEETTLETWNTLMKEQREEGNNPGLRSPSPKRKRTN